MEQSDDLRRWRLFATVAKTGSISSACTIFQTDAANLSRQLAQFEKSLGAGPLLDRSVRPLVLTENGKAAFECALKILQLRDELTQNLKCDPNALSGVVRVGLPPMVLRDLLTPFLVSFSEAYPDIDLRVDEYTAGLPINFENWRGDLFDLVVSYESVESQCRSDSLWPGFIPLLRVAVLSSPLWNPEDAGGSRGSCRNRSGERLEAGSACACEGRTVGSHSLQASYSLQLSVRSKDCRFARIGDSRQSAFASLLPRCQGRHARAAFEGVGAAESSSLYIFATGMRETCACTAFCSPFQGGDV